MTKEEAFKYWELFYQSKKEAFDYANILMKKEDYLNKKSKYGWAIDNKDNKTIALNQKETFLNTFPCSITAMNIRQGKQHFHINGREFNFAIDKKTKEKKLYEIKGKEMKCVDPHQRLEERLNDKDNEKIMDISGVKIKARQELNGNLVLVTTNEEQLVTGLFSLADYIDKFKSKIKDNKNILVEIIQPLAKQYEIPKQIYISTETNRSEDILLFRELILNKNTTLFDYNESEKTLYCYDENQTRKDSFIKKKQMLKDEIYFLTIRIEGDKGLLSMFFSEEIDDNEEEKAPEIDASFTFNLNKHDFTQELEKEELNEDIPEPPVQEEIKEESKEEVVETKEEEKKVEEKIEEQQEEIDEPIEETKEELIEEKEEAQQEQNIEEDQEIEESSPQDIEEQEVEEDTQEIVNEKYNHRFDTLLKINKEEIRKDLEKLSLEKAKKEMKEEEERVKEQAKEREREREEQEEQNKLKNYIEQEKYKTKIFKKADLKQERKEVEEVAKILADDIEKKKQEKKEEEERARREYEEKLKQEEQARLEEEERARLEEERIKEEEKRRLQEEIERKNKEAQEQKEKEAAMKAAAEAEKEKQVEIQEKNEIADFSKITEAIEKQALEENQENIESLGDFLDGDIPSQDQETTIQLEKEVEDEETEKKRKEEIVAKQLFRKIYGDNAEKGKDFAGRTISFSDYANYSSDTGWDYILLKDTFGIELENVILANVQTLGEFKMNQKFESNGHTFFMTKVGDKNILQSDEVLINPFSYYEAKRLSNINKKTKKNIIYIYVKCTEYDGLSVQNEHFNIFVDFIQRSISKMIITSLVKFEVGKDYIFISLDGDRNDAYEEAYNYAVLLNSYRKELKKDKIINAVIVLSSMETHHLNINKSVKDIALVDSTFKAIVEELSKKSIDPTIKRAIHIGPEVLNHLAVNRNLLSKSRLIQNLVKEEYYECKFVYMLNREEI